MPELADLPTKHLHKPWAAPPDALAAARVARRADPAAWVGMKQRPSLQADGPHRIVEDVAAARAAAREAVLASRRAAPSYNDDGGYDLIDLPVACRRAPRARTRASTATARSPPPARAARAARARRRAGEARAGW